jgi:hypothetical protein
MRRAATSVTILAIAATRVARSKWTAARTVGESLGGSLLILIGALVVGSRRTVPTER